MARHWTVEEDTFLRDNIGHLTYEEIGDALTRSRKAVKARAGKLGVNKRAIKGSMVHLPHSGFKSGLVFKSGEIEERAKKYIERGDLLSVENELAEMKAIRDLSREWMDGYGATPETLKFYVHMIERVTKMVRETATLLKHDQLTKAEVRYIESEVSDIILEYVPQDRRRECVAKIERAFRVGRAP